jgi:hypothetical protein
MSNEWMRTFFGKRILGKGCSDKFLDMLDDMKKLERRRYM